MEYYCGQERLVLNPMRKGSYLITSQVVGCAGPLIERVRCGTCHIFSCHTSCSITINENADPKVLKDLQSVYDRILPDVEYQHTYEGCDDMPSHALSVICGNEITIPITNGELQLGVWEGIILNEHRTWGDNRTLIITVEGLAMKVEQ